MAAPLDYQRQHGEDGAALLRRVKRALLGGWVMFLAGVAILGALIAFSHGDELMLFAVISWGLIAGGAVWGLMACAFALRLRKDEVFGGMASRWILMGLAPIGIIAAFAALSWLESP